MDVLEIFLYFWVGFAKFKATIGTVGTTREARQIFMCCGMMQVAEILNVGNNGNIFLKRYPWLVDHPHLNVKGYFKNTVYVASKALELPGCVVGDVSGAGAFDVIRKKLVLTG
jgi:hypothetical protein